MIDRSYIHITAGKGGRGAVAFRREKFVPRGGPSGGDGGRGGSIIVEANEGLNTLNAFRYKRIYKANSGQIGGGSNKTGRNGDDVLVEVPPGTQIFEMLNDQDDTKFLGDLTEHGQQLVVGRGGIGGRGNARFVTSVKREPLLAEDGEAGVELKLRLDLKLIADVGIVGLPNAGKSSLITALSNARPKIADYPFTTLEPNLGVVEHRLKTLVAVDVPGLIEGAHEGLGLGHEFLRHLERTRILVHLIDGSEGEPAKRFKLINGELNQYGTDLSGKRQIIVVNKVDIPEVDFLRDEIEAELREVSGVTGEILFISAAALSGLDVLKDRMFSELSQVPIQKITYDDEDELSDGVRVLRPLDKKPEIIPAIRVENGYVITHPRAIRLANGSDLDNWKTQVQMRERLKIFGVNDALVKLGITSGDKVSLGEWDFEWE
ncbi:MAG: GTPase ObgE [Chloroflexi bacterium]|nr:GTPase ObgE [Chloroflexota bacterium]